VKHSRVDPICSGQTLATVELTVVLTLLAVGADLYIRYVVFEYPAPFVSAPLLLSSGCICDRQT